MLLHDIEQSLGDILSRSLSMWSSSTFGSNATDREIGGQFGISHVSAGRHRVAAAASGMPDLTVERSAQSTRSSRVSATAPAACQRLTLCGGPSQSTIAD